MAKDKSTKGSVKNIDFSGVKDRGNFNPKQVAEGDYSATITKVEDAKTKDGGEFQYIFTIKLDKYSQYSYPYYCKLADNQLWKIRNLIVAAGINVPKKKMKVDPNRVVGKKIGVTMADDEYEGKMKSVVDSVFAVSELEGGVQVDSDDDDFDEGDAPDVDVDDDEPKAKKSKKGDKAKGGKAKAKKKAEPEPAPTKKSKKKKGKKSDADVEDINIDDV